MPAPMPYTMSLDPAIGQEPSRKFYIQGQNPVFIGNVEGDVYIQTVGPTAHRRAESPEQADLDRSTDALITWLNYNNFETRVSMVSGVMESFLVGAELGAMAMRSAMHDRLFDAGVARMVDDISKARPIPKVPAIPAPVVLVTIVFSSDTLTGPQAVANFQKLYGDRLSSLSSQTARPSQDSNTITASIPASNLSRVMELVSEASGNPAMGAEVFANASPGVVPVAEATVRDAVSSVSVMAREQRKLITPSQASTPSPWSPGAGALSPGGYDSSDSWVR